ncbi:hypothetical protein CDAR_242961 [Caerostris darwini]|uniref:Peptidase M12B propeptide domain-containing protein n=1 Tax=Caerostris darwini TaxID=1538125 RepID=A0AAV4SWL4_9ARAC|nr:hypothetical protein CDAR_242961 [Caerostris darwini]
MCEGASRPAKSQVVFLKSEKTNNGNSSAESLSYSFRGFNRSFILRMSPAEGLLSTTFHVLTVTEGASNSSLEFNRAPFLRNCIYEGFVENEKGSAVTMSVCNGLVSCFLLSFW